VGDFYATNNTVSQSAADLDFGSGGAMILPTINDSNGNSHWLAVGAGKDGNIYVVNRNNMGKYHPDGGAVYQKLTGALPHGEWGAPAFMYGSNKFFYGGVGDYIRAFSITNAKVQTTPASMTRNTFGYPGTTPSLSSQGPNNGIVWAISSTSTAVLYAYPTSDLSTELYDSNEAGSRDHFGSVGHFICPMIANGRVYVPTLTGVAVFGLLN
jgi:hypothetical protein